MNLTPRSLFSASLFSALALALPLATSAQTATPPAPTLHVSSKLVILDVVVADPHGTPIKGLKQSDFAVLEGKSPQTIASFEEHSAADPVKLPPLPKMPAGVFTNFSPAPENSAVNVLLLDALNTPLADQAYVRQQISVPAKGIYSVRALVNDLQGSHLGAVEIPLAAVQNLPSLNLPPPEPPK